jgi:hypothetical protein
MIEDDAVLDQIERQQWDAYDQQFGPDYFALLQQA